MLYRNVIKYMDKYFFMKQKLKDMKLPVVLTSHLYNELLIFDLELLLILDLLLLRNLGWFSGWPGL